MRLATSTYSWEETWSFDGTTSKVQHKAMNTPASTDECSWNCALHCEHSKHSRNLHGMYVPMPAMLWALTLSSYYFLRVNEASVTHRRESWDAGASVLSVRQAEGAVSPCWFSVHPSLQLLTLDTSVREWWRKQESVYHQKDFMWAEMVRAHTVVSRVSAHGRSKFTGQKMGVSAYMYVHGKAICTYNAYTHES